MRKLIFFIFTVLVSSRAGASPDTRILDLSIFLRAPDFNTLVIPIRRVQNLIVVEARIDTLVGNFILDTGAATLVLNQTYFRRGWEVEDRTTANAAGTSRVLSKTDVGSLSIRELYFENLVAGLSDLGYIENKRGIKILGLLGVSLFRDFELVIDHNKEVMYLHRLDPAGNVPAAEKLVTGEPMISVPFRLSNDVMIVDVIVGEKKLAFCIDTGAETNALSNLLSSAVLKKFRVTKRMLLLGAGGSSAEVLLGTVEEITVGSRSFKNMHAVITRLEDLGNAYGRSIDGILGSNFLVKGIITMNFVKKEFCMYPYQVEKP